MDTHDQAYERRSSAGRQSNPSTRYTITLQARIVDTTMHTGGLHRRYMDITLGGGFGSVRARRKPIRDHEIRDIVCDPARPLLSVAGDIEEDGRGHYLRIRKWGRVPEDEMPTKGKGTQRGTPGGPALLASMVAYALLMTSSLSSAHAQSSSASPAGADGQSPANLPAAYLYKGIIGQDTLECKTLDEGNRLGLLVRGPRTYQWFDADAPGLALTYFYDARIHRQEGTDPSAAGAITATTIDDFHTYLRMILDAKPKHLPASK